VDVPIRFDLTWREEFLMRMKEDGPWAGWELYRLAYDCANRFLIEEFTGLAAPAFLPHLKPLPHQLETAKTVVEKMNGRAILADEVGLGKTIEAGLILKEYLIRGLAKKVLILVPASLVTQWVSELNQKFFIPAVAPKKAYNWEGEDIIVCSLDTAKKSPHREIILKQRYDFVIVDEAHKLKNHKTKNYAFVQSLNKKFCLLLTATPIQNKAEEIFHLVTLLKPGHLGTYSEFLGKFKRKNDIANDIRLKELVRKVMVRNRREDTHIRWPKRRVENIWLDFSREEQDLYQALSEFRSELSPHAFPAITLLREACSSREAVYVSLKNLWRKLDPPPADLQEKFREIVDKMGRIRVNSKAEKALELIGQIGEKVILFTEYRATQLYLQWFFKRHGISSVPYRGGFKRGKKDWMKELFQNHAQVFISTEAGGEGINLQFCRHIINFDLPWNPMRLEQRIGRIHRVGQEKDVVIYNFAVKDTIEEHMVNLLYEKIKIFERVIGELDDILMKLDAGPFQDYLQDALVHSTSEGEARIKLENLSSMIDFANGFKEGISREAAGNPPVS